MVAYLRVTPSSLVTIKEVQISLPNVRLLDCQHSNLLVFIGVLKFQGTTYLVSEFAQISLRQAIAVPLDMDEMHISTVCGQVCLQP